MLKLDDAAKVQDIARCFATMAQLRTGLTEERFVAQVVRQQQTGYVLTYGSLEGQVAVVAGWRLRENLVLGQHAYVDDLVTDDAHRGQGYGAAMLEHIAERARAVGCTELLLDSGVQRHEAHRFYLRDRFDIRGYLFVKSL